MAEVCYCGEVRGRVLSSTRCSVFADGVHYYIKTTSENPELWPKSLFCRSTQDVDRVRGKPLTQEQVDAVRAKKVRSLLPPLFPEHRGERRDFVLVVFEQVQHFVESLRLTDLPVEVQRQQRDVIAALADALEHPKRDVNRASTNYDVSERALKFLAQLSLEGQSKDVNIERDVLVAAMKVYVFASSLHKVKCGEKRVGSAGPRVVVDHGYDD